MLFLGEGTLLMKIQEKRPSTEEYSPRCLVGSSSLLDKRALQPWEQLPVLQGKANQLGRPSDPTLPPGWYSRLHKNAQQDRESRTENQVPAQQEEETETELELRCSEFERIPGGVLAWKKRQMDGIKGRLTA